MAYTNANLSMYADDHQIYAAGCHLDEVEKNLNREGETATRWYKDNLLQGNHDKYQVMTVSNKNQDSSITVSVDGSNIQSSTDLKTARSHNRQQDDLQRPHKRRMQENQHEDRRLTFAICALQCAI